ncbi:phosphotransferase family enzyme [Blastococcus colisei]|uniref:Phosphotransferase family enzyme n=1 Tax=Blastococcus colisei TaxID=1564162 RepID=A0A543P1A2_9ACTN|nr:phosphotransferase [Blastococcus colisei]TQN37896.1 phosphotransferase family enzyme [Blastococcus colisei]
MRLQRLVQRPRAVLYGVYLDDGSQLPRVLAKVRRGWPGDDGAERGGTRPRLASGSLPPSESTALEYAGLRAIETMFGGADPGFSVVRPLHHLVHEDTILMEYVDAPTLRDRLLAESRLSPQHVLSRHRSTEEAWWKAGAWLHRFQREMPRQELPARQPTRHDVVHQFLAYDEFLTTRLGRRALGDVARRGAALAEQLLPERLPSAVGHGDYAPRNMFLDRAGRLTVFDPMPRWVVPRHEDLSRLLVAIRLLGAQLHTRGAAYSRGGLDRRERAVIEGYRAEDRLWLPELRCHQLLITLDKWSAAVDSAPAGWRGRLRAASVEWASGFLRRESRRLLELIESDSARTT